MPNWDAHDHNEDIGFVNFLSVPGLVVFSQGPEASASARRPPVLSTLRTRVETAQKMRRFKTMAAQAGLLVLCTRLVSGQDVARLDILVSFDGTNGATPLAGLIQGKDGSFYGTTSAGGTNGYGAVFQLTAAGRLTNLAWFNGTNGAIPSAAVIQAQDSQLYGTTSSGGNSKMGAAFRMTTNGVLTPLVSFAGADGDSPHAALIQAKDGNLYGTTELGGTNDAGTAFQMSVNGGLTNLFSFGTNGYNPYAGLLQGADGNLYGTTFQGGSNGLGTVFKMTTGGGVAPLCSFTGGADGANPFAALTQGMDATLYGTTYFGGSNGMGTVFKITTNGGFNSILSFNGTNGAYPEGALIQGADGYFYGSTESGGAYANQSGVGYGTVFKLATDGTLVTLASFSGTNGAFPEAGLVEGTDGNFYGTTASGGSFGSGTVFRVSFPAPPVIQVVGLNGSTLTLSWNSTAWQTYQIQYQTNLGQTNWINLGSVITATNKTATASDGMSPDQQRFYRVVLLP
jgi:uncharacterized repeat protein (TIGR03803 family)